MTFNGFTRCCHSVPSFPIPFRQGKVERGALFGFPVPLNSVRPCNRWKRTKILSKCCGSIPMPLSRAEKIHPLPPFFAAETWTRGASGPWYLMAFPTRSVPPLPLASPLYPRMQAGLSRTGLRAISQRLEYYRRTEQVISKWLAPVERQEFQPRKEQVL
jgi:hypothetical protein